MKLVCSPENDAQKLPSGTGVSRPGRHVRARMCIKGDVLVVVPERNGTRPGIVRDETMGKTTVMVNQGGWVMRIHTIVKVIVGDSHAVHGIVELAPLRNVPVDRPSVATVTTIGEMNDLPTVQRINGTKRVVIVHEAQGKKDTSPVIIITNGEEITGTRQISKTTNGISMGDMGSRTVGNTTCTTRMNPTVTSIVVTREIIGTEGVPEAWADSPSEDNSSDDELQQTTSKHGKKAKAKSSKSKKKSSKHRSKKDKKKKKSSKKAKKSKGGKKKKRKTKKVKSSSSSSSSSSDSSSSGEEGEVWIEKSEAMAMAAAAASSHHPDGTERARSVDENGDSVIGPVKTSGNLNQKDFGRALLPGEGAAMAAYVTEGKRIPRRGEIGLTSDEIANFEQVGYVMSGSRHRRMEAVRIRKENQIYSADEKRALAMFSKEERKKHEHKVLTQFKEMISAKKNKQN
ncbi:hypothetical protein ZHAS_00000806 [Anopheles sinensis]|uniref:Nkap_C domain-containing protein n=1 Tax=Anopheles sinensis TaxID=74873 RepID=A0A084VAJ7_ANOSI|nr:hypothetical protein ZHAS_00000806 [Anopheles sinensis]